MISNGTWILPSIALQKKKKRETENKFGIVKNIFLIKASWQGEFDY